MSKLPLLRGSFIHCVKTCKAVSEWRIEACQKLRCRELVELDRSLCDVIGHGDKHANTGDLVIPIITLYYCPERV